MIIGLVAAALISPIQVVYKVTPRTVILPFHSALTLFAGPNWLEIGFMALGGATTFALAKASYVIPAFPLHRIGYVLAVCFAVEYNWPAFLAVWIFKGLILRYSGRGLYVRLAPFSLGLVLGGFVVPVAWGFGAWLFEWYK